MTRPLSYGKYRGLQKCATRRGALAALALDHRNNLRHALNPDHPDAVTPEAMMVFKQQVVAGLAASASAALLDPEVGAFQCIGANVLPGAVGLIVALEATGYTGDPAARESRILPGWSVGQARRLGADAVKLLVYYHPDAPTAAQVERLVAEVSQECAAHDMALMLEPLSYGLDPGRQKLTGAALRDVVIETARRLTRIGGDVLKTEFPVDIAAEPDERVWAKTCADLTAASAAPWILLSASVDYETYLRQASAACQNGASGVAAGRAVWKEAPGLAGAARQEFLLGTGRDRMTRLTALCDALARPWTDFYHAPDAGADAFAAYR